MKKFNKIRPFRKAEQLFLNPRQSASERFVATPNKKIILKSGARHLADVSSEQIEGVGNNEIKSSSEREKAA